LVENEAVKLHVCDALESRDEPVEGTSTVVAPADIPKFEFTNEIEERPTEKHGVE
jgi:hypothetical protein